jgi:hypothetical protein
VSRALRRRVMNNSQIVDLKVCLDTKRRVSSQLSDVYKRYRDYPSGVVAGAIFPPDSEDVL